MILLWTTSNKIGSRIIRWGLDEPMSHFVSVFLPFGEKGLAVHQEMNGGFRIDWLPYFLKHNRIVHQIKPKQLDKKVEQEILHSIMNEFSGTEYDETGFYYFTWRAFLRKYFNKKLPVKNKWGKAKEPLCTGIARVMFRVKPEFFSEKVNDFDIITPGQLYNNLWNSGSFEKVSKIGRGTG